MSTPFLTDAAELIISEADMNAILTKHFCSGYGAFRHSVVVATEPGEGTSFRIQLGYAEPEEEE